MRICIIAVAGALLTCHASDHAIAAETRSGEAATSASPPLAEAPFSKETARSLQQSWASHLKQEVVETNSLGMKMVLLPPGEFTMGRNEEQFDELVKVVDADPKMKKNRGGQIVWSMLMMPAHRVRLTKPFYMGATEVTVAQFRQFTNASGYRTEAEQGLNSGVPYKGGRPMSTWRKPMAWRKNYKQQDDESVMHLCWNDCVAFCKWLSEKEGVEYALPTEAEWEYACRAGTTTPWSFGDFDVSEEEASQYAIWSNGMQKFDSPQRVAQRKPNPFGLYDMHGNMWEYVADWWHRYTYKESPLNDPTGPVRQSEKNDLRRIIRGSSFDWGRWGGDSAHRMRITQRSNQHPHMSFRVAMRIKDVAGVPPAFDPDDELRRRKRDPGADSEQVAAALKDGAVTVAADGKPLPEELSIELSDKVKMEFVLIPAGSFVMGSEHGDRDELPLHRVVISRPFYMARYELTQSQWEALMGTHQGLAGLTRGGDHEMSGPTKAMNLLSWNDCQRFIQKVKAKAPGHALALPTEAQWEYACRAGSTTTFSFGDDESQLGQHAYYQGNMNWPGQPGFGGKAFYHDVGQKKPNAWGLYDMHGGVWEWCNDWYDSRYYFDAPLVDPAGPEAGRFRVLRGGSWFRYAKYARSAYRKSFHPEGDGDAVTAYINDFGCRLVINPGTGGKREQAATPGDRSRDRSSGATAEKKSGGEVGFTKLARSLVRRSDRPVITVGRKGEWDDQTLGCMTVFDDGQRFFFYSGGAQFGKAKNIGMATSEDGIHWSKPDRNPLFPGAMPYVLKVRDTFRIYYPGKDEAGRQGLLMRTSTDGFQWSAPQLVLGGGFLDPCVVQIAEDRFHLYYCGGGQVTRNGKKVWEFKTNMATSADGIAWQKLPELALPLGPEGSWDAASHAGPVVLKLGDGFHMWHLGSGEYNGKVAWRIGHATSPDGLRWTKSGNTPVLDVGKPGAWDGGTFMSFDIVYRDGKLLFWYAADPGEHDDESKMSIHIGYGTSQPDDPRNASKTHHPPEAKAPFNAQQAGEFQQQ